MPIDKISLDKIFISHSSIDKPFVRKLARRLQADGYRLWIDETELIPGDSLPNKVSQALSSSRVVLVVVSAVAIRSKWFTFEINKATERMIQGECRLIPLVIEKTKLPPEVQGILYADFTKSFTLGYRSVATALQYEAAQLAKNLNFYARADAAVEEVFGKRSFVSLGAEYSYQDHTTVTLPHKDSEGYDLEVVYESITDYLGNNEPLLETWSHEFVNSKEQYVENLFLVVTERPLGFHPEVASRHSNRVSSQRFSSNSWNKKTVVFVDLSHLDLADWNAHLSAARSHLIDYAWDNGLIFDDTDQ